mgnify:CR=1 FL=1
MPQQNTQEKDADKNHGNKRPTKKRRKKEKRVTKKHQNQV